MLGDGFFAADGIFGSFMSEVKQKPSGWKDFGVIGLRRGEVHERRIIHENDTDEDIVLTVCSDSQLVRLISKPSIFMPARSRSIIRVHIGVPIGYNGEKSSEAKIIIQAEEDGKLDSVYTFTVNLLGGALQF